MIEKITLEEAIEQILGRMRDALVETIARTAGNDRDAMRTLISAVSRDGRLRGIPKGRILARGDVAEPREVLSGLDDAVEKVYGHVQDAMYRAFYESCGSVQAMPVLMTAMRRGMTASSPCCTSSLTRMRTRHTERCSTRTVRSDHRNRRPSVGGGRRFAAASIGALRMPIRTDWALERWPGDAAPRSSPTGTRPMAMRAVPRGARPHKR